MDTIQKKIVTDENSHPVAVLKIESALNLRDNGKKRVNLSCFSGRITLDEDPLAYQRRIRDEWQ
ncbi:MAG: hypothetical protein HQL87_07400 [Magnetococcales bacterium]|nr:hypothetical protein [Magnetococcales bacterium]